MMLGTTALNRSSRLLLATAAAVCFHASSAHAAPADLTRHLETHVQDRGPALVGDDTFFGTEGPARLIVRNGVDGGASSKVDAGSIEINGREILGPHDFAHATDELSVPIDLRADDNTIRVRLNCNTPNKKCKTGSSLKVRVKQVADITLNWTTRIHFNTNVSSFAVSRPWYRQLGFNVSSGFPDTNTLEVAESLGIKTPTEYDGSHGPEAGGYLLRGELIALQNAGGVFIDLIEFKIPRNTEPPYAKLNHLGMARAALMTTSLDADYAYMTSVMGVKFLSPPVTRSNGTRFAIFQDPDGTYYELQEVGGLPRLNLLSPTNIVNIGAVNINVSDFERSRAFYKMLGFEAGVPLADTESPDVARAMGFVEPIEIKGEQIFGYGTGIELVQWIKPHDPSPPYPIPINHIGINRLAYVTADLSGDVATLKSQGVEFISEIAPCCSGPDSGTGIVSFYDPDGTIIELFGTVD